MEKKYELTDETIFVDDEILYRIRALRDIPRYNIKAGDLGGYIEKEYNLSHYGDAWVSDNAWVFGYAKVFGNAKVFDDAWVYGRAQVFDSASVYNEAKLFGNAQIFGNACVFDNAQIFGNASVLDTAQVFGNAWVFDNAIVFGDARVPSRSCIASNAYISSVDDFLVVGPIGSYGDDITFYKTKDNTIWVNCEGFNFNGSIDDFLKRIDETHGTNKYAKAYYAAADLARIKINLD